MSNIDADKYAREHHAAELGRYQLRAISQFEPNMDMADAYRIQAAWIALKLADGQKITGRKVGLTSRAMQSAMKINEPDFGTLLDGMYFPNGAHIEAARFNDPRIEAELAFVLKEDISGEDLTITDVLAATDYVVPSLELIDSRSYRIDPETGYTRIVVDTVADNAANAGYCVGDMHIDPYADLRWCGALLYSNGIVEETGLAAGVLDHPANGLIWLAKRFAPHGIGLQAGHIYLAGSFTRPVAVAAGDEIMADYGPYGTIRLNFT